MDNSCWAPELVEWADTMVILPCIYLFIDILLKVNSQVSTQMIYENTVFVRI